MVADDYDELIGKAVREHSLMHYAEALLYFKRAHRLQPSARTLRGLALASFELRRYVQTLGYIERALSSDVRPVTASMRRDLIRLRKDAALFVSGVKVEVSPDDAQLLVDGHPVTMPENGLFLLDMGRHEIVARADGFVSQLRTVQAEGDSEMNIRLDLAPAGESAGQDKGLTLPQPPIPEPAAVAADESGIHRLVPWLLIGGSAAAIVAGGMLAVLALRDVERVENAAAGSTWREVQSGYERSTTLSAVGFTLMAAGAAGTLIGIVLELNSPEEASMPHAFLELTPAHVRLRGTF